MMKADIGLIGLATMGQNLALNIERNQYTIAVYNRTTERLDEFINGKGFEKNIIGCYDVENLCNTLKKPRIILLMIKAGKPVDDSISMLLPFLEPGDIIIDGGNSFFSDTIRRLKKLENKGIHYLGAGISGGEEGALKGPSIMPGGSLEAWKHVEEIFTKITAKINGDPCCSYIGSDGAGHYVKMVHNGIEYSDMQLISEIYYILKKFLNLTAYELAKIFAEWDKGDLNSYLIKITSKILLEEDPVTKNPLVDMILDSAKQKGTGKWASQEALEMGVPVPSITEAVYARNISSKREERLEASKLLTGPTPQFSGEKSILVEATRKALIAAKICSYAQGFSLLKAASDEYKWELNLSNIAQIWRNGCIIRARFLKQVKVAFQQDKDLSNLLLDSYFSDVIKTSQEDWRFVVNLAVENGIPIPALSSALSYYDSYRNPSLPANLIQAQRDYFGAHGFERVDKEQGLIYHYEKWAPLDED
ncbi:MAG: NADP-dependent phosphogluconate dehydrogenase [Candidatus Heimdallarchaeota archaeon]|nr:MAG: NADP-dependent phosphogluconate dehydrogenase [Candidatus Heimdallarchaeota archaeon]